MAEKTTVTQRQAAKSAQAPLESEIESTDLIPIKSNGPLTPMTMIERALISGASVDVIEKLLGLQERWDATQARKTFNNALAEAKAKFEPILKNREVGFESKRAGAAKTNYMHEDLHGIAEAVDPALSENGLFYRWRTKTLEKSVEVTCVLSHRDGHSEENSLSAMRDETGNKNSIQAVGSTITYLQRYTLKAALGLAITNDDDGKFADGVVRNGAFDGEVVSDEQRDKLVALADEVKADKKRFCEWMTRFCKTKVVSLADVPAANFNDAIKALEAKRRKK